MAGKSSGGYGAMVTPMLRPDLFGGLVTHAGDALFEVCYGPDFREAARALRDAYDGSFDAFWADFRSRPGRSKRTDGALLNVWCMAACYSADADGTVRLPFEPLTGRLIPEIWDRWLAWDPVRMAPRHADALRGLRAIWIDAGRRDDFYLDLGAEAFRGELAPLGVDDDRVRFELFDGTHAGIDWRYPEAIGWLAERLSADGASGGDDPVATGALGHEQGDVRGAQERLARRVGGIELGATRRDGDRQLGPVLRANAALGEQAANLVGGAHRVLAIGAVEHDDELLAAEASDEVAGAEP